MDGDFSRARRWALVRRVLARLRRKRASNRLLSFDDVRRAFRADNRTYLGRRVVEVEKIVGSVGWWSDFDPSFLPVRASVGERWKRIDRPFHRGEDLPPVELYKIADAYFVLDGHHRVSVARYHGAQWIDARVIEVGGPVSEKTRLRPGSREHESLGKSEAEARRVRSLHKTPGSPAEQAAQSAREGGGKP